MTSGQDFSPLARKLGSYVFGFGYGASFEPRSLAFDILSLLRITPSSSWPFRQPRRWYQRDRKRPQEGRRVSPPRFL